MDNITHTNKKYISSYVAYISKLCSLGLYLPLQQPVYPTRCFTFGLTQWLMQIKSEAYLNEAYMHRIWIWNPYDFELLFWRRQFGNLGEENG